MTKLDGKTPDLAAENIAQLRQIFPDVFEEGKIDFDRLKQVLGEYVDDEKERYNFTWNGKGKALRLAQTPTTGTLRPCEAESKNWDDTQNLYIEGDNLEVLKLLQKSYHGKIKMIYIDPPYNTGGDFVYPDDFSDSIENYKRITGQVDEEGKRLSPNTESNGRYHTDWLNMIYPRLRLARNLLSDEGVICISIDNHEIQRLQFVCDEIFGMQNMVTTITWEKGRKNDSTFYSDSVEYIAIYAKNIAALIAKGAWRARKDGIDEVLQYYQSLRNKNIPHDEIEQEMQAYYNSLPKDDVKRQMKHFFHSDERGLFFGADISSASTSIPDYDIIHPITHKPVKKPSRGWGATEPVMLERIRENRVLFGEDETTIPLKKSYLEEVDSIVKTPVIYKDGRAARKCVQELLGGNYFDNPKDHLILADLISYVLQDNKNANILDFFSGSATTAHAVMQLNAEDGGDRKFIMVQLPEPCSDGTEVAKADYKNICEIGKERIRRAGEKIKAEIEEQNAQLKIGEEPKKVPDIGFKVFKLDSSNLKQWQPDYDDLETTLFDSISNYVDGRSELDVVYEIVLKMGMELTWPLETHTIGGKNVYEIGMGALMICLDDQITTEVAEGMAALYKELAPETWRVVFKDNGFADDSTKVNIKEILKTAGLEEDAFTTV